MDDDAMVNRGAEDNTPTLISLPVLTEFPIQCKTEPDTSLTNEDFDESSALHIQVSIPMIKNPIVLLERCDKIWETLQLIKTVQIEKSTTLTDECDKNEEENNAEEKAQCLTEVKQSVPSKHHLRLRSDNTVPPPFKFSVQKTRKLYPCITCGKQYLERRSLRKHSERVHGVILPLQRKYTRRNALNKKNFSVASQVPSINKENNNSEKLHDNKDSCEKVVAKTKLTSIETTSSPPAASTQYVKCTLCQTKVLSLRKHLINYHKIGGSSSMMEQLESSLLSETKTSSADKRAALPNESHQDGFLIMDNENDISGTSQNKKKKNYTLSYGNVRKKRKLNNERYAFVQNPPIMQKQMFIRKYKCDICLGFYSSAHSLYKHKRIHKLRGETKDNFHKFKCRYFNSPFNKHYKTTRRTAVEEDASNSKSNTLSNQNSSTSNRAIRYNERMSRNNETVCLCGRSFRNPHTLYIHKKNCELFQTGDNKMPSTRTSRDRDSGIGINITIKKRNDSYEIVGKDDEDKLKSEIYLKEDPLSVVSNNTKDFTKASTNCKQQVLDTSEYSKDHSILKLQDTDEDVIIDIEDDVQIALNDITRQTITQSDCKQDLSKQQNDDTKNGETEKVDKVSTLKQMCQEVLDVLELRKSGNVKDKNKKYNQIKDQETYKENSQVKNKKIHQANKRELRSTNKRHVYSEVELDHSYDGTRVSTTQFSPLVCGYCREQFNTVKSYDNHQCAVKQGRSFDEFSLQLRCFCCKDVLNNYNEFDEHVRSKHFDRAYHCYQCPERFPSDKMRLNHFHSEHNDLICTFCNKKISISVKALHEGYHLGFGYPCHKCKKAYMNNKSLSYHRYTIHSNGADNLMTCTICLKLVKLKSFRRHMTTHKHNACHFCGKVFSDRVGIEYHTMMHHGTNSKLKCNICGTRFYNKKQLERHERIDGCNNAIGRVEKEAATELAKNH